MPLLGLFAVLKSVHEVSLSNFRVSKTREKIVGRLY